MQSLSLREPLVYIEQSKLKVSNQGPARLVLAAPMRGRHAKQNYPYALNLPYEKRNV